MEDALLTARVDDALKLAMRSDRVKTVGFLSESEQAVAARHAEKSGGRYGFFGGYEQAERRMFIALPAWCEGPETAGAVVSLTLLLPNGYRLAHRDVLGTLMALGMTRESVGDILLDETRVVVFLTPEMAEFAAGQVRKIGGVGVVAETGHTLPLPGLARLVEKNVTVASLRLDGVVAALTHTSREKAKEWIEDGLVSVDSKTVLKTTAPVHSPQWIRVRQHGRFRVDDCAQRSRKDRVILRYSTYE